MSDLQVKWGRVIYAAERVVAMNVSSWSWEYDANERVATVYMGDQGGLRLTIVETHTKSGLGAGKRVSEIASMNLGNVRKPSLGGVRALLGKHSHSSTRAGYPFSAKWTTPDGKKAGLGEILADAAMILRSGLTPQQVNGMRAAIMDGLDGLTAAQVEAVFNLVRNPKSIRVGGA
jgi:hypothetical protein